MTEKEHEVPFEAEYSFQINEYNSAVEQIIEGLNTSSDVSEHLFTLGFIKADLQSKGVSQEEIEKHFPLLEEILKREDDFEAKWQEIPEIAEKVIRVSEDVGEEGKDEEETTAEALVEEETTLEEELNGFESWNEDFKNEVKRLHTLYKSTSSIADITTFFSGVRSLRLDYEIAVADFSDTHVSQLQMISTVIEGFEKRADDLKKIAVVFRLAEEITSIRGFLNEDKLSLQDMVNASDHLNDLLEKSKKVLLDNFIDSSTYEDSFTEAEELIQHIEEKLREVEAEQEKTYTEWVAEVEVVAPALNQLLTASTKIIDGTIVPDATTATDLQALEKKAKAEIRDHFSPDSHIRERQESFLVEKYFDPFVKAIDVLAELENIPAELLELKAVIDQVESGISGTDWIDTTATIEEVKQDIDEKKFFLELVIETEDLPASLKKDIRLTIYKSDKLKNQLEKIEQASQKAEIKSFLAIPELSAVMTQLKKIDRIGREHIEPHAEPYVSNTYSVSDLETIQEDLTRDVIAAQAIGYLDLTHTFFDDKSEDIQKAAADIINKLRNAFPKLKDLISYGNKKERQKPVDIMSFSEVIEELSEIFKTGNPRAEALRQRYLTELGGVKNKKLRAWYRSKVVMQDIAAAGDSGHPDFGIFFDKIMPTVSNGWWTFTEIARAFFLDPQVAEKDKLLSDEKMEVTTEDLADGEINTEMIRVWDYIVARIKSPFVSKDELKRAGLDSRWSGLSKDEKMAFSYNNLTGDQIDIFTKHLKNEFPTIKDEVLGQMIKYCLVMASKSGGYVGHLAHEVTRAHGTALAALTDVKFSDELAVCAPFSLGFYSRGRYALSKADATAGDLLFVPEPVVYDTVLGRHKKEQAVELTELVEEYREVKWSGIPDWVMDVRKMIENGTPHTHDGHHIDNGAWDKETLNIFETWYPLPGEVTINIMRVEQAKRDFLAANPHPTDAQKAAFARPFVRMGYGSSFDSIGITKLGQVDAAQYIFAYKGTDKLFQTFRDQPKLLSKDEAIELFIEWMSGVIGKAKLIPGKHQLMFGPKTLEMIYRITHSYNRRTNIDSVNALRREIIKELVGAGGVPLHVKEYVLKNLGWTESDVKRVVVDQAPEVNLEKFKNVPDKFIPGLVSYRNELKAKKYKGNLYWFKNASETGVTARLQRLLPLDIGKRENGAKLRVEAPYEYRHIDRDTSKK